jgi:hypothetical protein
MRLYVLIHFWVCVSLLIINLICLAGCEFPIKRQPKSMGQLIAEMFIGISVAVWAGIILWL